MSTNPLAILALRRIAELWERSDPNPHMPKEWNNGAHDARRSCASEYPRRHQVMKKITTLFIVGVIAGIVFQSSHPGRCSEKEITMKKCYTAGEWCWCLDIVQGAGS